MESCKIIIVFILLILSELLYFRTSRKYNILDKPNERSSHSAITIRGGGIIFYLSILYYTIFLSTSYLSFFVGLTFICFISFIDDIYTVTPKIRLIFHLIAILLMFFQWELFNDFPWWCLLITLVFCIGIMNAYNFMDGINGMTGGYSLVMLLTLIYIDIELYCFIDPLFLIVVLLSVSVFCFFNFRTDSKCFAGDVGSIGIAFILVFVLGMLILKTQSLYWLILLSVYGVDSLLTIVHRLLLHENIFQPHRKHIYQIIANELHVPHVRVSFFYMLIQLLINTGCLLIHYLYNSFEYIYFICVILILSIFYVIFIKRYFKEVIFCKQ